VASDLWTSVESNCPDPSAVVQDDEVGRDRNKVARYEVPGKAATGDPSRRVRSDGLHFRIYNLAKGGCVDRKKLRT
jgi:hypothetical protein